MNIVFDLDGTLIKTENIALPAIRNVLKSLGYNHNIPDDEIFKYIGYTIDEIFEGLLKTTDKNIINKAIELLDEYETEIIKTSNYNNLFFDGAFEVLENLKEKKHILYILSNCNIKYLNALLDKGLNKYIDSPHCAEMYNWQEKDVVLKKISNGKKDFIMIGDRHKDIEAAKKNGFLSIGCAYGFGEDEVKDADYIVHDIKEILPIIDNLK
ncbi:phosphoglycolate phosphatase [Marinitoga hydrogenitolerans DSM 16785]|uniref:Phosphoglycolate phosphatase n=1 Tax=Marinitoga hydrogenitolerans (strain DSM 16785 / JCM 12826 / AT1271) TaxID=1122195 RepID=A0A1M4VP82_MARH1|nr:HAD family hydrolase [Marinitoga hydrogenitolerans]SHE70779.1 phosphoglycolate phosphatase [Marinitoga hydrogenitolerans DSM 16785]